MGMHSDCEGRSLTGNVASLDLSEEGEAYERCNANARREVRVELDRQNFGLETSRWTYKLPSMKMAKMASFRPLNVDPCQQYSLLKTTSVVRKGHLSDRKGEPKLFTHSGIWSFHRIGNGITKTATSVRIFGPATP